MAFIVEVKNAFDPNRDVIRHEHPGGITIWEWLQLVYPGFTEFEEATICVRNGECVLREKWSEEIDPDDKIVFITTPGHLLLLAIIYVIVIALTIYAVVSAPATPGELPASAPVYSVKGQKNDVRLGEPIEVAYGKNRISPSFAAIPFYEYQNNDQFAYLLFCLGQGSFVIEDIFIADTLIDSFQEVSYQVVAPNESVTLIPTNVVTSVEAGNLKLFAPNETEYVAPGYGGTFATNPANTLVSRISLDFIFPDGLYYADSKGGLHTLSVTIEIDFRKIDDTGAPLTAFVPFTGISPYTFTMVTTTPQRITLSLDVAAARYEVRCRRTSNKESSTRRVSDIIWDGMRGYLTDTPVFGDVTLVAVKIRATNNLNQQTLQRFSVVATRMIPILESDSWVLTESRSLVWAFIDVFRSAYGGRVDERYFDMDALMALDTLYTSRNEYFDFVFRDPITVWDAARAIGQVGRATPTMIGSLISLKRDGPQYIPVTMFTPDNIVAEGFQWNIRLWDADEFDSINVEYTEPATGYKQETVLTTLPGGTADNPRQVRLLGCSNRTHAFRWGLYQLAVARYRRENAVFETGMEGLVCSFGDLVAVAHDVPKWGQSGIVVNAVRESGGDEYCVWLSEPLDWTAVGDYRIVLRGPEGQYLGPYPIYQSSNPMQAFVTLPNESPSDEDFDFLLTGRTEPMLYLFGTVDSITKYARIVRLEPQGGEIVRITVANDNPLIYSFDDEVAPVLENQGTVSIPDLPVVDNIYISDFDNYSHIVTFSWSTARGALSYVYQTSFDGVTWGPIQTASQPNASVPTLWIGDFYVRVAGVNVGQGPWVQEHITLRSKGYIEVTKEWTALEWEIAFYGVAWAFSYKVRIFDNTVPASPVLKHEYLKTTDDRIQGYDYTQAAIDGNLVRNMRVILVGVDGYGGGEDSGEVLFHNDIPSPATGMLAVIETDFSTGNIYRLSWTVPAEEDLHRVRVWLSHTSGFNPAVTAPFYDYTHPTPGSATIPTYVDVEIPVESSGSQPAWYWRVGLFDVWGNEISTNVTAEQTIPPFP